MAKRPTKPKSDDAAPASGPANELGPACRIALFVGPDAFLRTGYTDHLKAALQKAMGEVDVLRFDGASAAVPDVLDECRSMGLIATHKLVIVDDADQFVKEAGESDDGTPPPPAPEGAKSRGPKKQTKREVLERYAESPAEGATLVLRAEKNWHPGKLDKLIARSGVVKPCTPPTPEKALAWMVQRAKNTHQRTLEPRAAEALLDRLGVDLALLDGELAKLAASVQPGGAITPELVASNVRRTSQEEKPWVLADHLLHPDPRVPLEKIHELIELAEMDEVPLRGACISTASKLHAVARDLAAGVPPQAAGRSAKLWGPSAEMIRAAARRVSPKQAAELLRECVEADYRGKSGGGDIRIALEVLGLRFSAAARGETGVGR